MLAELNYFQMNILLDSQMFVEIKKAYLLIFCHFIENVETVVAFLTIFGIRRRIDQDRERGRITVVLGSADPAVWPGRCRRQHEPVRHLKFELKFFKLFLI